MSDSGDRSGRLQGKVAVVTGAGRGIGRALARSFAREGAIVVLAARTNTEIEAVRDAIVRDGGRAQAIPTDVADEEQVRSLYSTVHHEHGRVDLLVINAGGNFCRASIEESDPAEWVRTVSVNLTGAYYSLKYAIPLLRAAEHGRVICTGSGMGHNAPPGTSAYACGKAGLWMLVRQAAQELRDDGISVNELIPGPVDTQAAGSAIRSRPVFRDEWVKEPDDVVPLAMFLATHPGPGPTAQSFSIMRRPR
jgi:3-oxoacyl-[acyl-carrier protein] reductase